MGCVECLWCEGLQWRTMCSCCSPAHSGRCAVLPWELLQEGSAATKAMAAWVSELKLLQGREGVPLCGLWQVSVTRCVAPSRGHHSLQVLQGQGWVPQREGLCWETCSIKEAQVEHMRGYWLDGELFWEVRCVCVSLFDDIMVVYNQGGLLAQ